MPVVVSVTARSVPLAVCGMASTGPQVSESGWLVKSPWKVTELPAVTWAHFGVYWKSAKVMVAVGMKLVQSAGVIPSWHTPSPPGPGPPLEPVLLGATSLPQAAMATKTPMKPALTMGGALLRNHLDGPGHPRGVVDVALIVVRPGGGDHERERG